MEQFRSTISLLEQSETELLSRYNQQRDRIIYLTTLVLWLTVDQGIFLSGLFLVRNHFLNLLLATGSLANTALVRRNNSCL